MQSSIISDISNVFKRKSRFHFGNKNIIAVLISVFLFIAIPRLIFYDLDHGDEYTDANVLTAGENFVKFGFIKCHFLPAFSIVTEMPQDFYTHCPPLLENFNGWLRVLFKTDSLYFFRIISLMASFVGVLFWYFFIAKISHSPAIAFLSAIFYITNPLFIHNMDSLHESCYSEVSRVAIFLIFLSFLRSNGRKKQLFLIVLWFMVLINALITFEYIPYLAVFFILFGCLYKEHRHNISIKVIFILFTASTCAFMLHFLQNIWHFGSFSIAFQDFRDIAYNRTFGSYEIPGGLNFLVWWRHVIIQNLSRVFIFNGSIIFLPLFFSLLLYLNLSLHKKKEIKNLFKLFIILIICGVSWYIFFPAHSLAHSGLMFLARHFLPAAPLGFVIFFYTVFSFIKEKLSYLSSYYFLKIFTFIFILIIAYSGILKSELPITPQKILFARESIAFKKCLLELKAKSDKEDIIGVNYFRFPFIRYYTNRNCSVMFNKSSLENSVLPKCFIFIPYNNQQTQELYNFLNQRYVLLFKCDSARFPSIFFQLKDNGR